MKIGNPGFLVKSSFVLSLLCFGMVEESVPLHSFPALSQDSVQHKIRAAFKAEPVMIGNRLELMIDNELLDDLKMQA